MYKLSVVAAASLLLIGCGGGSGTSSGAIGGNGGSTQNTLSLTLKYENICGQVTPATDAAILIHKNDMSNEKIIMANANGQVEYKSSASTVTFSTIMRDTNLVANTHPVYMRTFIDHPMINADEVVLYTQDESSCTCQTSDLKVNLPVNAFVETARLSGVRSTGNMQMEVGSVFFSNVEYCQNSAGQWPLVTAFVKSIQNEAFGAIVNDIASVSEVEANLPGVPLSISADDPNVQVYSWIEGNSYFRNYDHNYSNDVYGFEADEVDFYSIDAYDFTDIYDVEGVDLAYILTSSAVYTDNLYQNFYLQKPELDYLALVEIIDGPGNYAVEDNYGYDYVVVSLDANYANEPLLSWNIIAPLSGNAINVDNIDISQFISDSLLENYVDGTLISIGARGYAGINGYQDYLTKMIGREPADSLNSLWSKRVYSSMTISMSGMNFADFSSAMSLENVVNAKRVSRSQPKSTIQ